MIPPLGIWPATEWNPILGCSPVDNTCIRCYAAARIAATNPKHACICADPPHPRFTGKLFKAPSLWEAPLGHSEALVCFAFSMSDPFHEALSDQDIGRAFDVMKRCHWQQFNLLTKRAERMAAWKEWPENVRAGISCGTQALLEQRWPLLKQTPAAYRYLSVQPMLEPIILPADADGHTLSWVQVMREVGPGARHMDAEWVRVLRDQCHARGILLGWEVTDYDSRDCKAERLRARMAGHAYATQRAER